MYSVSRLNTDVRRLVWPIGGLFLALCVWGQMAEGPGREETEKMCSGCHEVERSISLRQDRDGWKTTINKMVSFGAQGTEREFAAILDYLSTNYPAETMPRLNVNTARAIEFESRLTLRRSEAAAIVGYRNKRGRFKSIDDLKSVPGVDPAKIEAKRDILVF
jgi:competence protein ComEA